jgi:hypothetical protein
MLAWGAVGGAVMGTITSASGDPVAGVHITVISASQGIQTKTTSNAKGGFRFPTLAVGQYEFKVEAPGYKAQNRRLIVHVDDIVRIDVVLEKTE